MKKPQERIEYNEPLFSALLTINTRVIASDFHFRVQTLYSHFVISAVRSQIATMASITTMSVASLSNLSLVNCSRISGPRSISLSVKGRNFPSITMQPQGSRFQVKCAAKPDTVKKVSDIVKKQLALPEDSAVTGESKFSALGADSLDTVEIVMGLEEEFGISVEEESAQTITTVQEAADMIEKLLESKS